MIADFKEALNQRSLHFLKSGLLKYELPTLQHALDRFDEYLDSTEDWNEHDVYIFGALHSGRNQ